MADNGKAVINLTTGHEDADKVTVAFLVATAALTKGKATAMFHQGGGAARAPGLRRRNRIGGRPAGSAALRAIPRRRRRAARLPDLLPGARARRFRARVQRPSGRRDPAVGLDR
jgi:hypothetical protein